MSSAGTKVRPRTRRGQAAASMRCRRPSPGRSPVSYTHLDVYKRQRVLDHYLANRAPNETFREYEMRHKVETFRGLTSDLAKPADLHPEIYQDWGDDTAYSLQLGRGECAV